VLANGSRMIGNATGGGVSNAEGAYVYSGAIIYGDATAGSATHGAQITSSGVGIIGTATGTSSSAYGVLAYAPSVVVITTESGAYAKSLAAAVDTSYDTIPFAEPTGEGGGGDEYPYPRARMIGVG